VLAFGFVYRMTFGGSGSGGASRTRLHVLDEDETTASARFVAALRGSKMLAIRPAAPADGAAPEPPQTVADLRAMIDRGDAHHALILERGFGQTLARGELPTLRLIRDPRRDLESQFVAIGMMSAAFEAFGAELAPALTTRALLAAGLPERFAEQARAVSVGFSESVTRLFMSASSGDGESGDSDGDGAATTPFDPAAAFTELLPVTREDRLPGDRPSGLDYMMVHNVAGMAMMMLMFGLVSCGLYLLIERDLGTLARLLAMPAHPDAILLGKLLFAAVTGFAQLVVMFAIGQLVFGVAVLRDLPSLFVVSLFVVLAVTGFGMLIATLARTMKQAEGISTLIILLMSAIGGAWFPIDRFDLPAIGEIAARSTLTYWGLHAYKAVLFHGESLLSPLVLRDLGVLFAFGVVALLIARLAYHRRVIGAARHR
jgi:ABC-2 type transport system permease protein